MAENVEVIVARLEQQIANAIDKFAELRADLKIAFDRIERESKSSAVIKSDLTTHIETSKIREEDTNKKTNELLTAFNEASDALEGLSKELETAKKGITGFDQQRAIFETEIRTTVKTLYYVFGALFTVLSAAGIIYAIVKG